MTTGYALSILKFDFVLQIKGGQIIRSLRFLKEHSR